MDAIQPHREQSGVPPNWHGVIQLFRSAETVCVVFAKMQKGEPRPGVRHGSKRAGDHLDVDAAVHSLRQQRLQFTVTHQGIAADNGKVERLQPVHQIEDPLDQSVSAKIAELPQRYAAIDVARTAPIR